MCPPRRSDQPRDSEAPVLTIGVPSSRPVGSKRHLRGGRISTMRSLVALVLRCVPRVARGTNERLTQLAVWEDRRPIERLARHLTSYGGPYRGRANGQREAIRRRRLSLSWWCPPNGPSRQ
jgi:hypothetical protein